MEVVDLDRVRMVEAIYLIHYLLCILITFSRGALKSLLQSLYPIVYSLFLLEEVLAQLSLRGYPHGDQ